MAESAEAASPSPASAEAAGGSDIFLCYARQDAPYVTELVAALRNAGLRVWVDLAEIPPADPDWPGTVEAAIVAAPALLFVLSPDSARSDECRRELDVALAHGKQIVVVSHRPLEGAPIIDAIRRSNWITGRDREAIGGTVASIVGAYTTDLVWKRYRTELEVAATKWHDRGEDQSYLLRGNQLEEAEREVAARKDHELPPTALLVSYLRASRQVLSEENRRRTDSQRVAVATEWLARAPTTAALVLLEVEDPDNTPFAILRMNEVLNYWLMAEEWKTPDSLGAFDLSADGKLCVSASTDGTARIWRADGVGQPVTIKSGGQLDTASFSPDGRRVVLAGNDGHARVWRSDGSGAPMVFKRHGTTIQFSPHGDRLAMASENGTCRLHLLDGSGSVVDLIPDTIFSHEVDRSGWGTKPEWLHRWSAPTGAPGRAYVGGPLWYWRRAEAPLFSPDGELMVIGSLDGIARLWRSDGSGAAPVELHHEEAVLSACFGPDGRSVLTASYDGRARVWPVDGSGDPVVLVHDGPVIIAGFSPDGGRVVTASEDGTARVWSADGKGSPTVLEHGSPVLSACFSPEGERVLTVSTDGAARIWSAGRAPALFREAPRVVAARFSRDGSNVVIASENGLVRAWSHRPRVLRHRVPVNSVRFGPRGRAILTGASDNAARLWKTGDAAKPLVLQHADRILAMSFSSDGEHVVTASQDGTAQLCRTDGSESPRVLPHDRPVNEAVFDPTGTWLATGSEDGLVRLWRTTGGAPVVLSPPGSYKGTPLVKSLAFSPSGDRVLAVSGPFVRVWRVDDPETPLPLMGQHFGGYIEYVRQAQFSADGHRIVTLVEDKVRVWAADGGGEPVMLTHGAGVDAAVISADGSCVATVSAWDGMARVWDLTSPPHVTEIRHGGSVEAALFSPNGQRLAIITGDRAVRIWRSDGTGEPATLWHEGKVESAAFSGNGERIVTVSQDGSARVWSADGSGEPFVAWHEGSVHDASFSPDGHTIVTASEDGTARVWLLSGSLLRAEIRQLTRRCLDQEFYERYLGATPEEARRSTEACAQDVLPEPPPLEPAQQRSM